MSIRAWLAAVLAQRDVPWPYAPAEGIEPVVQAAAAEGVLALLQARLLADPQAVPVALVPRLAARAHASVARSMYQQARCREVLRAFAEAGVPVLLLKGSALAYWLYASPHLRECSDIDVLVADADAAWRAVMALRTLGYAPDSTASAGDLVSFETCCVGGAQGGRLEVDVHWRLSNAPLFAFRFGWDELWAAAQPLPGLALGACGLAPVPALLHACMHRTQHLALGGPDKLKWLHDLWLLGRGLLATDWRSVQAEAVARGLAGVCLDGLAAAQGAFGPFVPDAVFTALAAAERREALRVRRLGRWWYFQYMDWRAFPERRQRWRWLRQRLLPNAAYLRERHGVRGGVAAALGRRALAGLRRLVQGTKD